MQIDAAYELWPRQAVRRIAPPYAAGRPDLYRGLNPPEPAERRRNVPDHLLIQSRPDGLRRWGQTDGDGFSIEDLILFTLGRWRPELEGDTDRITRPLAGDIVYRPNATEAEYLRDLERVAAEAGSPLTLTAVEADRPVVVLGGRWRYTPARAALAGQPRPTVELNVRGLPAGGGGSGDVDAFAATVGGHLGRTLVVEAEGVPARFSWQTNLFGSTPDPDPRSAHDPVGVALDRLREQTGLTGSEQTRRVRRLVVGPARTIG